MRPRPTIIPLFPRALDVLSHWRALRWYLLMLLPHMTADVYLGIRSHSPLLATFMIIVGALLAAEILTSTYTGLTSSNWGTFLRAEQPVGYWHSVTVSILIYLGMIAAAVFVPIAR